MSVLELPLLTDLVHEVGKLVLPITSCLSIIILENTLKWCIEKCGDFNHRYVSPIHIWMWEILRSLVRMCTDRLLSGPSLPKL
jgi:hypothetical protein